MLKRKLKHSRFSSGIRILVSRVEEKKREEEDEEEAFLSFTGESTCVLFFLQHGWPLGRLSEREEKRARNQPKHTNF